jgi:8-hydroxy-5-deazaflavin:NADPH oxidoreductase
MTTYHISVLGTGDMGGALAQALKERTQHVISVRGSHPGSASTAALIDRLGVRAAKDEDIEKSDILFVVVPAKQITQIVSVLKGYRGIVVSVSVSGTVGQDGQKSCAEQIAEALPAARVVNAFTSIWSNVIRDPGNAGKTSVFVCSDDEGAKTVITKLAEELGFEPINAGKLSVALYAEALGMFAVRLALDAGHGRAISFRAFQTA